MTGGTACVPPYAVYLSHDYRKKKSIRGNSHGISEWFSTEGEKILMVGMGVSDADKVFSFLWSLSGS